MREFLFRGKAKDGKWYFGDLVQFKSGLVYIQSKEEGKSNYVIPETVGQFTGLTDKNGKKIFEGDIVKYTRKNMYAPEASFHKQDLVSLHKIYWSNKDFMFRQSSYTIDDKRLNGGGGIKFTDFRAKEEEIEVIGNIHDNPELLEVQ